MNDRIEMEAQRCALCGEVKPLDAFQWISGIKSSTPCTDCGGYFHWAAMTYDHLPGHEKRDDISNLIAGGYRSVLVAEMAKCEIVCANCHAIRTFRRREEARARRASEPPSVSEAGCPCVIGAASPAVGRARAVFVTRPM